MRRIPTRVPDVQALLLPILDAASSPVGWYTTKPATSGAYKHGILRADLQGHVTPISRYCRVGLQGWAVTAAGVADLPAAFDLAAAATTAVVAQSGVGVILDAELQSGPLSVVDPITKLEYAYSTLLLEVAI